VPHHIHHRQQVSPAFHRVRREAMACTIQNDGLWNTRQLLRFVRRLSLSASWWSGLVVKALPEGIELGASIFLHMIPNTSGSNEGHPCRIVFIHRV